MRVLYLHGFASSPGSGKARYFRERLAEHGVALDAPDFNLPDFESMTVTRMLDQVDAAVEAGPAGPVAFIGSSLGAFVAVHAAARRNSVAAQPRPLTHLILMAPALEFGTDRRLDAVAQEWRRTGRRVVFHYAYGKPMTVGYGLYEDARHYDSTAVELAVPILVFQGRRDEVVRPETVVAFAERRPNVTLRLLDDDHQLQGHLGEMWADMRAFLDLGLSAREM